MQLTSLELCVIEDALKLLINECNIKQDKFSITQKLLSEKILLKLKPIIQNPEL